MAEKSWSSDYIIPQHDDNEVEDLLSEVTANISEGVKSYPDMTYEEGIRNALWWLFGTVEDHPYRAGDGGASSAHPGRKYPLA